MKARGKTAICITVMLCLHPSESPAADVTWNVPGPASWNVADNWLGGVPAGPLVPDASFEDVAVVGNGGTVFLEEPAANEAAGLRVTNGTAEIRQGGSLTIVETFGILGSTSVDPAGTLVVSGDGTLKTHSLTSRGTIDLQGTDIGVDVDTRFSSTGTLRLGITSAGSPVVDVAESAQLGGMIVAAFADDVDLSFGNSWPFMQAGSVSGQPQIALAPGAAPLPRGLKLELATTGANAAIAVGNVPILSLDRTTGKVELSNVAGDALNITGYSISSANGLLSTEGWASLTSQQVEGWTEANPHGESISELNLSNQTTLEVGVAPLNLGNAYNAALGAAPAEEDVTFQVSTADGRLLDGLVEYTGPINDLTLLIDPENGDGRMQNLSSFIDPFEITAYRILSESGALSVEGWTSFADTGEAGDGWTEANPLATAITELNVTGSTVFSNGTAISLGSIFTPGSARDVALEFATIGGELRSGTVEYASLAGDPSDCNGDGLVDISDANCTPANQLDAFLMDHGFIKGDADGSGEVQFPDFVILANNFGNPGQYTDGDFDKDGLVQFPDFVILADNFGQSAGAAAAVPEPSTALLGLVGLMGLVARYRWWARSFR